MSEGIADWGRPHFTSGGGDPFVFYVAFGPVPSNFSISRGQYMCDGIPDGIEVQSYGPGSNKEVVDSFREGYLWGQLRSDDNELANLVADQSECLIISGNISDPPDLSYFRNIVGLVQWLFDSGIVALYDPHSFRWWSQSEWEASAFNADSGAPRNHVAILCSADDDGEWLHTRGMRKFGRPDLGMRGVLPAFREASIDLINRFIEFQAFGGVIREGEEIRVQSLPDGMTCHHRGEYEDPDFNNVHVEIRRAPEHESR